MLTRRTAGVRWHLQRDESGFSLIEVVVAMVVLMVFAGALSVTLLNSLGVSKASRQRVAAANLASRELEIVRNKFANSDADALAVAASSSVINGNPLTGVAPANSVVDGSAYTVRRDVQWLPTGTGVSACDGGGLVNYPSLQVVVTVTWSNMRTAKPVRAETLMTPLKGTFDNLSTAFIAAQVKNGAGKASAGVTATATGPGGTFVHTTDASGCAVFQVGTPGTYTVTLDMAGWVDQTGTQISAKTPVVVAAGTLVTVPMTYDNPASMDVTMATVTGYALPTPLPAINYIKSTATAAIFRQTVPWSSVPPSVVQRVSSLWPTTNGYAAWPGSCADSDPAVAPFFASRGPQVVIPASGVGAVTATLPAILLTVKTVAGVMVPDAVVTATSTSTCAAADKTLTLGKTGTGADAGLLKASLPYGSWKLNTTYQLGSPPSGTIFTATPDDLTLAAPGVTPETFQVN